MEPAAVTTDSRTTKGITHEQRYHLCLKKQECPAMKQSELAAWFNETYSFPISQPTISHSLKKSAEILARGITSPGVEPTRVRRRPVRHPELEQAIFRWVQEQQQKQQQEQKVGQQQQQQSGDDDSDPISGPVLIRQAKKIAREMNMVDTCDTELRQVEDPTTASTTWTNTAVATMAIIVNIITNACINVDNGATSKTKTKTNSNSSPSRSLRHPVALGKVQSLQEAQRLVQLLRQYAGSYLQDPTGALKSLESLEWELDPTRMRGSITISEMGDDHD
ncbi:hypothetical protein BGX23_010010 [Mortierella sp. AD031]|nr:hypothetical protein BGX23_010010 [Mortierella sp. AD031]